MSQTNPGGHGSTKYKKADPTSLDNFERFCQIVNQYLRWPIQLLAVVCCFIFMDADTAWKASLCVLSVGNASTIAILIEKWKGHA